MTQYLCDKCKKPFHISDLISIEDRWGMGSRKVKYDLCNPCFKLVDTYINSGGAK